MVKLSRPSSLSRNRSANANGNSTKSSNWTKPVEFNRVSSSKRWSFRKTESTGGESEFTLTRDTSKSKSPSKSRSKSKSRDEPNEFTRAGESFNRVASAADAFLATGTFEYDSEDDISRTHSSGGYKLRKSFSLTNSRKGSALSSATTDDRNDDGGDADENFWNPFSGMFGGEEGRDADDDCSQFTYDSASQMSAGTEQTGATDLRSQHKNGVTARDGSFFNAFARSVSNHLNPDNSIGEEQDDEVEYLDDDSRYHLETRSSGRDSSYYSTDDEDASSWDDDDDDTRRTNPHSFDGGEESEAEGGGSKPTATATAASDSKSKEPDAEYLYHFSSRVRIDDGADRSAKESKKPKDLKDVQETSCEPATTSTAEPAKTKKSRGRALKKMVPKFRSSKKNVKKATTTTASDAKSTTTSTSRPKNKKGAIATTKPAHDAENEAALRDMMETARHVAAEESREADLAHNDGDGEDDARSLDSLEYSQYSHAPSVLSNKTTRSSKSLAAKMTERKEAARIKKEIRNRDKAREATLRRMEAEERKRLKAEKREAEIAAANAKEAEARAKLAALIAEAKLKKQQDEIAAERRANAKKVAEKAQKEEQLETTKGSEGTTPQETAPAKAIPLTARAQSVEERFLRAADAVDMFLATGRLEAPWSPREQDTEEPVTPPPPPPPPPQQSSVASRTSSPKPTNQYSEDITESNTSKGSTKHFARARSLPRRTRSLSRPKNLFGKKKKDQLDAAEDEEEEEFTQEEEEPFDVNVFKKKQAMEQPNAAASRNIARPPSVEIDEDFSDSEESEGYSEESSYLSEDFPMDEPPPPPSPRRSAVSDLLSQPPISPLLPPLPASPQHSVSSRSMATYDPTAPSSPRSIGSAHHESSSFVRSTTYRPGDISVNEELPPSALRRQPSPKRSVSFKRPDDVRNDVIAEEDVEGVIEQNMNDMALQTNQKLSPRAAGSRNTFCIHEYDDEGHQAVVYNSFSNNPIRSLRIFEYDNPPRIKRSSCDVLVKIQASTVSYSDCIIRQGKWWGSDKMAPPITPGVDFVGKITSVGDEAVDMYGYSPGDTVASLVRCGGNARYAVIDASKLIDVPDDVEPTSAACMLETYLAAFQSLHLDEPEETRYEKTSMLGKTVLIIGGISMIGQAMIELAFLAGASTIYVTAKEKHHDFLRSLGAVPLSMNNEEWLPSVKGRMDLIVDAYCTNHYSATADALDPNGKMVCIKTKTSMLENDPSILWQAEAFLTKMGMSPLSQTFTYDVYESWEENIDLCKDDMVHLFDLLRKGLVEPPIADCIPLTKVPQAQKIFETKRIQGFFVCEPWLKRKQKAGFC